jgi:hypothetical protein
MQTNFILPGKFFDNLKIIALIPALCVIADYLLTFYLAGTTQAILQWEASPLVRFAVENNILVLYVLAIVIFYYGASYLVLRILHGTEYYLLGASLVILVSFIHLLGGLSWYIKNPWYSNGVLALSVVSILVACLIFFYSVVHRSEHSA